MTTYLDMGGEVVTEINPHWNCSQVMNGQTYYRIPGRDARNGDVTHKLPAQMNRKERRAMRAVGFSTPQPNVDEGDGK